MQRLEFANKSTSKNQKTEQSELENSREVKGAALSQTRNVFYMSLRRTSTMFNQNVVKISTTTSNIILMSLNTVHVQTIQ